MSDFVAILVVGVGSYLSRIVFIVSLSQRRIPDNVLVALQFVAPAVLASLIVALLIDNEGNIAIGAPELAGLVVGAAVANWTRSHVWTLIAGMGTFWLAALLV